MHLHSISSTPDPPVVAVARPFPPYGRIAVAAVILAAVGGAVYLLATVRQVFFLSAFSIVLAFVLHYPITFLSRAMPRPLAAVLTLAGMASFFVGFIFMLLPSFQQQAQSLLEQTPRALEQIRVWWRHAPLPSHDELFEAMRHRITDSVSVLLSRAVPIAFGLASVVGTAVAVFVLAFFLAWNPRAYLNGVLRLVPRRHTRTAVVLFRRLGVTLRAWTGGTLLGMTLIGLFTATGLYAVGLDTWFALGLLAFIGAFIPFVGPVVTAVPALVMGFAVSPTKGLAVLAVYLIVQQVEGHVVQPLIMKRAVRIQPAVLLLWQLLLATAFGLPGLLVATPLLAAVQITVKYLYVHRTLGKPIGWP